MGMGFTACSDDDDDEPNGGSAICGVWASVEDIEEGYDPVFAIKIMSNGTGQDGEWSISRQEYSSDEECWNWRVDGNTMYISEDGEEFPITYVLSNNNQNLTIDGDEEYVKVK